LFRSARLRVVHLGRGGIEVKKSRVDRLPSDVSRRGGPEFGHTDLGEAGVRESRVDRVLLSTVSSTSSLCPVLDRASRSSWAQTLVAVGCEQAPRGAWARCCRPRGDGRRQGFERRSRAARSTVSSTSSLSGPLDRASRASWPQALDSCC